MSEKPFLRIVAANVQRLQNDRKRLGDFTHYSKNTQGDIFLISETGRPSEEEVTLWKQECEGLGLSALFFPQNNTAILWRPSPHVKLHSPDSINNISSLLAKPTHSCDALFDLGDLTVRVFSIYSPCQDQQGKVFIKDLAHRIPTPTAAQPPMLLGGDWNCVVSPELDSSNPLGSNHGGAELRNFLQSHTLSDSYRLIYPRKRFFTNSGTNGTNRRLDYIFLCPQLQNLVQKCTSWEARGSTHVPVVLDLAVPGLTPTGPGSFKLGVHTIEREGIPEYLQDLTARLHTTGAELFPQDAFAAWDHTKILLKTHLSDLSRSLAKMDREASEELKERNKQAGAAIRARLKKEHTGASSVYVRLRQTRQADLLPSLKVGEKVFSKPDDVIREARKYCANLFLPKEICQATMDSLMNQLEKTIPR
jgi:exonuclease III